MKSFVILLLLCLTGCARSRDPQVNYQAKSAAAVGGALAVIAAPASAPTPAIVSGDTMAITPTTISYHCDRCRKTITVNPSQTKPHDAAMIHCPTCGDECKRVRL